MVGVRLPNRVFAKVGLRLERVVIGEPVGDQKLLSGSRYRDQARDIAIRRQ